MRNNELISKGFNQLLPVLSRYVATSLRDHYGDSWWNEAVLNKLSDIQRQDLPEYY